MSVAAVISIPPRAGQSATLRTYLRAIRESFEELDWSDLTPAERDGLVHRQAPICAFMTYPAANAPEKVLRAGELTPYQRKKLILWLTLSRSRPLLDGAELFLAGQIPSHDPAGFLNWQERRRLSDLLKALIEAVIRTPALQS
jgi:hypothetical protein